MFPLVETIKVFNGEIYNLPYHQLRLDHAFERYFKINSFLLLEDIIRIPENFPKGLVKLRFLYTRNNYKLEYHSYQLRKITTLKMIENNDIDYTFKFTDRTSIKELFEKKDNHDDVLILKNKLITDTSIANIVFYNGHEWLTPATPLLKGTCREKLLKEGKIKEEIITINDLKKFNSFCLINAMTCGDVMPLPIENIDYQNI